MPSLVGLVLLATGRPPGVWVLGVQISFLVAAFALRHQWSTGRLEDEVEGRLTATGQGLFFDGRLLLPRERIRAAVVIPRPERAPIVRFERRGGIDRRPVVVRVPTTADGWRLLHALGQDASQTVANFHLPSQLESYRHPRLLGVALGVLGTVLFVGCTLLFGGWSNSALASMMMAFVPFALLIATVGWSGKLHVGADGVLISSFVRRRFIPYSDITAVTSYDDTTVGIELTLRSGGSIRIPVQDTTVDGRNAIATILERIREALRHRAQQDPVSAMALLLRGAGDVRTWIQTLRALGAGANTDHRTAPVPTDTLIRIVEDAGAGARERVGAAIALGAAALDDADRQRLAAAANATAAPKLRVALTAACDGDGDDEALVEAMACIEDEQVPTTSKSSSV